jgi:hypothetical protein
MCKIYNQLAEDPGFHYNRGWKDADSYAAFQQKQQADLWEWWEMERDLLNQEIREEANALQIVVLEDGYTIHDQIKTKH